MVGMAVVDKSLTIVLPIHNGESRLRAWVGELLELASELTPRFAIQIVDDGSTDATYEIAEELATRFPQVSVRRYRHRRGLGATLEAAERTCRSEVVIVHDGVTPLDPNQVRKLWRDQIVGPVVSAGTGYASANASLADIADLSRDHASMQYAHSRVLGFQLLSTGRVDDPTSAETVVRRSSPSSSEAAPTARRPGVGQIPPLPRPKFLSALATFARAE